MFNLPLELQRFIYEFDSTWKLNYEITMKELVWMSTVDRIFGKYSIYFMIDPAMRLIIQRRILKRDLQRIHKNKKIPFRKRDNKTILIKRLTHFYNFCIFWNTLSYVR